MNKEFLLAVPVYNEVNYVENVCEEIKKYYQEDILVVNDGSTDGSQEVISKIKDIIVYSHTRRCGYGKTLIDIFQYGQKNNYSYIITMDCDLQHEPHLIPEFQTEIRTNRYDIISGSRYLTNPSEGHCQVQVPEDRQKINKKITEILNSICKSFHLTDAFCGFNAYNVNIFNLLRLSEYGYSLPLQFWVQAENCGLKIKEIPVELIYHDRMRCFGGFMDNPEYRLKYYLNTIKKELKRWEIRKEVQLL